MNCRWTSTLALFLERLTRHLAKRAVLEQSPGGNPERGSSDDEEVHVPEPSGTGRPVVAARAPLTEATQRRVALAIVQLATKAQYAKVLLLSMALIARFLVEALMWKGRVLTRSQFLNISISLLAW